MKNKYLVKSLVVLLLFPFFNIQGQVKEKPIVFNQNESVGPGEAFSLQGHAFSKQSEVWYSIINGNETTIEPSKKLEIISVSDINITALLPKENEYKKGNLIVVWVKNEGLSSGPVFLNRARAVTIEFEEIMPKQSFRIFGRNLSVPGYKPEVFLKDKSNGKIHQVKIKHSEPYILTVEAPQTIRPGAKHEIIVSNGAGGKWGQTIAEELIVGKKQSVDYFKIGTTWAVDFDFYKNSYNILSDNRLKIKAKGDGIANDREAIQKAIDLAHKDGGGVVYLPKGKYKLEFSSGSGLIMKSRVVLKGDGPDKTVVQYGFGTPPPYPDPIGKGGWPNNTTEGVAMLWNAGTVLTGLADLKIQNVNTSGIWRHSLKNMPPNKKEHGSGGYGYFAVNCHFDLAVSWGLSWAFIDRVAVVDCHFDSKAQVTWPWLWHCDGVSNFVIRNNRVLYSAGRLGFNDSYNGIIENNHITRYGDLQTQKGETGGFNIDFAKDIIVMKNRMDVIGKDIADRNQGETILSQGGNPSGQSMGDVSRATSTTLTDDQQNWSPFHIPKEGYRGDVNAMLSTTCNILAIISGRGCGQWRHIAKNDKNTIHVNKAWDVIPDATSRYAVVKWSAEDWLVKDNILEGNNRGIWFYCGGTDYAITGNKLVNSEGIYLRSDQRLEMGRYNLTWNATVDGNTVIRTLDKRPAHICSMLAIQSEQAVTGVGTICVDIRNNEIQTVYPNITSFIPGEGYWNEVRTRTPQALTNAVGIIGTILENNKVRNVDYAYRLSNGIGQTVIKDAQNESVKNFSNNGDFPESDKVNTTIIPKKE